MESQMTVVMPMCEPNNSFRPENFSDQENDNILRLDLSDQICHSCSCPITDRYLLRVLNDYYHENCLRCVSCDKLLPAFGSCFTNDGRIFCKDDHLNYFIPKCAKCCVPLQPHDLIQRSKQLTFHAQCFQCGYCGRQLQTGDQYFCVDGQIICQNEFNFAFGQQNGLHPEFTIPQMPPPFFADLDPHIQIHHHRSSSNSKKTPKRPRTILNSSQRRAFKIAFEKGPKPSKKVREQLAKETGLSVRVVQVWFQNQRAKIKKIQRKQDINRQNSQNTDGGGTMTSTLSMDSDPKSPLSLKSLEDSDSEDVEVDSGRSSSATIQRQSSSSSLFSSQENSDKDPIDKLYHMQNTYFAYA